MSAEQNKTLVRGWLQEFIMKNNPALAETYMAGDYVNHFLPPGTVGPDAERQILSMFFTAFPDLKGSLEDIFAEGDRVAVRIGWRGTNTGSLMGMPPTGKWAEFAATNIFRISNGKIAENWPQVDMFGLMQQLGATQEA